MYIIPTMANGDKFVIKNIATPLIWISSTEGNESDALGSFTLHEDIPPHGGDTVVLGKDATGTARWFYDPARLSADISMGAPSPLIVGVKYTDGTTIDEISDSVMGLYVKHLGIDENGDPTQDWIFVCMDGATSTDAKRLLPNESCAFRTHNVTSLTQADMEVYSAGGGTPQVQVEVLVFCDDKA